MPDDDCRRCRHSGLVGSLSCSTSALAIFQCQLTKHETSSLSLSPSFYFSHTRAHVNTHPHTHTHTHPHTHTHTHTKPIRRPGQQPTTPTHTHTEGLDTWPTRLCAAAKTFAERCPASGETFDVRRGTCNRIITHTRAQAQTRATHTLLRTRHHERCVSSQDTHDAS